MVESLLELLDDFGINEEIVSISHENIVYRESLKTERTLAVLRKAKAALAEPLKNCEVGNDREQDLRFYDFCGSRSSCVECPLRGGVYSCSLSWSQMPYESEVK
jgi:hypothetical protein